MMFLREKHHIILEQYSFIFGTQVIAIQIWSVIYVFLFVLFICIYYWLIEWMYIFISTYTSTFEPELY